MTNIHAHTLMKGRVLICAGSDSGGGAGIQADIKTVTALGGFATTAITALTAQNTMGVSSIIEVPINFLLEQLRVVLSDLGADCIKTGMLHSVQVIEAVSEAIEKDSGKKYLVVDPVMVAKGGQELLESSALHALKSCMIVRADLLTPNIPESESWQLIEGENFEISVLATDTGMDNETLVYQWYLDGELVSSTTFFVSDDLDGLVVKTPEKQS